MRDPTRIYEIMGRFQELWLLFPDMRFGQLVENVLKIGGPGNHCIHPIEDDVTLKRLEEYLGRVAER